MDAGWKNNLEMARQASKGRRDQSFTEEVSVRKRNVSFFSYMPALLVALMKDILDLVFIGSLPGIGTIVTFCFSLLIFFLLMLAGSGTSYSLARKGALLLAGTLAEGVLFGLNFLPIETITIFLIYRGDKRASKKQYSLQA